MSQSEQQVKITRMRRIKTKVSREHVLNGAREVFTFATKPGHEETMLEVEFQDEVGTGLVRSRCHTYIFAHEHMYIYVHVRVSHFHARVQLWNTIRWFVLP